VCASHVIKMNYALGLREAWNCMSRGGKVRQAICQIIYLGEMKWVIPKEIGESSI